MNKESNEDSHGHLLKQNFFVPAHPIIFVGKIPLWFISDNISILFRFSVIGYGLFLTMTAAGCPESCLPSFLPLGSFASMLGQQYPTGKGF